MSKMLEDFCAVRDSLVAELREGDKEWITAWEAREGIDTKDWEEGLALSMAQFSTTSPALQMVVFQDPLALLAIGRSYFVMGWELNKLYRMREQFDAAS